MIIVATTSLPAVNRPNADRWNAARSCQLNKEHKVIFSFFVPQIAQQVSGERLSNTKFNFVFVLLLYFSTYF